MPHQSVEIDVPTSEQPHVSRPGRSDTTGWQPVSHDAPCPICGKDDWCGRTDDGAVCCRREVDPPPGWRRIKQCADGSAVFRRIGDRGSSRRRTKRKTTRRARSTVDWSQRTARYVAALGDNRLTKFARELGVTPEALRAIAGGWDGRKFTFPERDAKGRVVGIATRTPDGRKGFMKGGKRGLIVPRDLDGRPGLVHVVEGPTDVATLLSMGIVAVGRPSARAGVAHLVALLRDRDVIIVGENDQKKDGRWPGRDGAKAVGMKLATEWDSVVRWTLPPDNAKDARSWLNNRGLTPDVRTALETAGRAFSATLVAAAEEVEPDRAEKLEIHVDRVANRVKARVEIWFGDERVAVERVDLSSSNARRKLAKEVASKTGVSAEEIENRLMEAATAPPRVNREPTAPTRDELLADRDDQTERELVAMPQEVVEAAQAMLLDPHLVDLILDDIAALGVVGEQKLALTLHLVGTSRHLDDPLSAIVQGTTSSGKSLTINRVACTFPEEAKLTATHLTPQSLYYLPPARLIHTFVVAGERSRLENDDRAEATRALREMQSAGQLIKVVTIKLNGQFEAVVIHRYGPIAFAESTTLTQIFDEDANRALLLGTDESSQQTARITRAIARRAMHDAIETAPIIQKHHALQRLLRRVEVKIPFADRLAATMPTQRPEARRAIGHTLDMIRAVALLHQRQRADGELQHGDVIDANLADYVVARRLLDDPLGRSLGGALPRAVAALARRLTEHFGSEAFATVEAVRSDPIISSRGKMGEHLRALADAGVVELVERGRGNRPSVWKIIDEVPLGGAMWLPTVDDLEAAPCAMA